jgi:hypothetical protein
VFLTPFGNRLIRKTPAYGTKWVDRAAELLAANAKKFVTVGVPSIYLQPHTFDNLDTDYEGDGAAYLAALQLWDVFLFTDMEPWGTGNPELPLYRLLNGKPNLAERYDTFIMHICRSRQEKAGGKCDHKGALAPSGIYTYDDKVTVAF